MYMSTYLMDKLMDGGDGYNYEQVKKYLGGVDIFSRNVLVFIPINIKNGHWTLLVVDAKKRRVQYYDSKGASGSDYLKAIQP